MVKIGKAKRGAHAGEWFVTGGYGRYLISYERDGKEVDLGEHSDTHRVYFFPRDGDKWFFTDFYFNQHDTTTTILFEDGKAYDVGREHYHKGGDLVRGSIISKREGKEIIEV